MFDHTSSPEKTFSLKLLQKLKLEQITRPDGRKYVTPEGNSYPSVTTALAEYYGEEKKEGLTRWREAVGDKKADLDSRVGLQRGNEMHDAAEKFLLNESIPPMMPDGLAQFNKLKKVLIDHVDDIHLLEGRMWSDRLKLAGTVDCIARFGENLSIIDFKNSKKLKKREWIEDYFLQTACYSFMAYERYGIKARNLVVLISCFEDNEVQIFQDTIDKYIKHPFFTGPVK